MVEDHRVLGAALAHGAQAVDVFEHVRQRHMRIDHDRDAALFLALDLATAGVEVADHVTDVIFRRHHLDLHHRLEQLRASLLGRFTEAGARSDFEREHRGRSEEHTSELQSLMRITYAVFCLQTKHKHYTETHY